MNVHSFGIFLIIDFQFIVIQILKGETSDRRIQHKQRTYHLRH